MIGLVTGGRPETCASKTSIWKAMDELHEEYEFDIIAHGMARGTDMIVDSWCLQKGVQPARMPALWEYYDRDIAGPRRNRMMLLLKPDVGLVFKGGSGTRNMARQMLEAKIPIRVIGAL